MASFADACRDDARALAREAVRALPPAARAVALRFAGEDGFLQTRTMIKGALQEIPKAKRKLPIDDLVEMIKAAIQRIKSARTAKRRRGIRTREPGALGYAQDPGLSRHAA